MVEDSSYKYPHPAVEEKVPVGVERRERVAQTNAFAATCFEGKVDETTRMQIRTLLYTRGATRTGHATFHRMPFQVRAC